MLAFASRLCSCSAMEPLSPDFTELLFALICIGRYVSFCKQTLFLQRHGVPIAGWLAHQSVRGYLFWAASLHRFPRLAALLGDRTGPGWFSSASPSRQVSVSGCGMQDICGGSMIYRYLTQPSLPQQSHHCSRIDYLCSPHKE